MEAKRQRRGEETTSDPRRVATLQQQGGRRLQPVPSSSSIEEDEERRQAELRRAHDQLQKCIAEADYMAAVTMKEKIDALRSGEPCPQLKHGRAQADWRRGWLQAMERTRPPAPLQQR